MIDAGRGVLNRIQVRYERTARIRARLVFCTAITMTFGSNLALADEGGVSFWLTGQ